MPRYVLVFIISLSLFIIHCSTLFTKKPGEKPGEMIERVEQYAPDSQEPIIFKDIETMQNVAALMIQWCIQENSQVPYRSIIPFHTQLHKVEIDTTKKTMSIYFSEQFAQRPFRADTILSIKRLLKRYLGNGFHNYQLNLITLKLPVEQLVPNYFRDRCDIDSSRIPKYLRAHTLHPQVQNLDKNDRQAARGLFNRHIALWPSHGWYYSLLEKRWEWQRPRLFTNVEDLYPLNFIYNYLVPMLENAGAYVFIPRERDWQSRETVVDNDSPNTGGEYQEEGRGYWSNGREKGFATGKLPYQPNENPFLKGTYRYCASQDKATARIDWIPDIPEMGYYAVYISYYSDSNSVNDALYTVYHTNGSTQFLVNQTMGGKTWIYLGRFWFDKGMNAKIGKISLTNISQTPGKIVTADAVRFGGGMGNIAFNGQTSGKPRFAEGARTYLQYAGIPDTLVYNLNKGENNYNDDYQCRGEWVNYLIGAPYGPNKKRDSRGLGIPIDLSFGFHTDAGIDSLDGIVGTLSIYSLKDFNDNIQFPDSTSRFANRDFSDLIQTQIVDDIRASFDVDWQRRDLRNAGYSEASRPNVPSCLLELLSHQNFADMKYGLDPHFQFTVCRAIYKAMLRYIAGNYSQESMVQPLPVSHLEAHFQRANQIQITWRPTQDPTEPLAVPSGYVVYLREGAQGNFDAGTYTPHAEFTLEKLKKNTLYCLYITAWNSGGESMPSETIAFANSGRKLPTVLVVQAFDRVSIPGLVENNNFKGLLLNRDQGVPDNYTLNFTGEQFDFDPLSPFIFNDAPGWGNSYGNYEAQPIKGNTHDHSIIHGEAILEAGYSFVTASDEAVWDSVINLNEYKIIDLILGEEKLTTFPSTQNKTIIPKSREFDYQAFPTPLITKLTQFCKSNKSLLINGAFPGTELFRAGEDAAERHQFAKTILQIEKHAPRATNSGSVSPIDTTIFSDKNPLRFNQSLSGDFYSVEAPDALYPTKQSRSILQYSDNRFSAAVAYEGVYRSITIGFPLESIIEKKQRFMLMKQILDYLKK